MTTDTQSDTQSAATEDTSEKEPSREEQLEQELAAEREAKLRALADFQNYRKRSDAERSAMKEQANAMLLHSLAELIDDYYRSEQHAKEGATAEDRLEGLQMVFEKLEGVLKDIGLEVVEVSEGDSFDPETMEALTTMPTDDKKKDNTVMHVESKGYRYSNGTVFRTAKVVTAKYQS